MKKESICRAEQMTAGYQGPAVIHEVSFDIRSGEILGILGPNGAGKSTIIRTLTGLLPLEKGSVLLAGRDRKNLKEKEQARILAVVPQSINTFFSYTVRQMVEMGRYPLLGPLSPLKSDDIRIIEKSMKTADVHDLSDRPVDQLSGGEMQRVLLARALAQDTPLILLDEPTSHQDLRHQILMFNTIREQCRHHGKGVLCILHDMNLAAEYCDRLILLHHGRIVASGTPEEIIRNDVIRPLYGQEIDVRLNPHSGAPMIVFNRKQSNNSPLENQP
jgi:iron complex transport system ATP-binding protein